MLYDRAISRRALLIGASAGLTAGTAAARPLSLQITAIEAARRLRIGVSIRTLTGRMLLSHRPDQRFLFCSTFKVFLAGAVLRMAEANPGLLQRRLELRPERRVGNSPVTDTAAGALPVEALCAAVVQRSDNWAANLLIDLVGGPAEVTRFLRRLGDPLSRLDRDEPSLNVKAPGGLLDTTTPAAAAGALQRMLGSGGPLSPEARALILGWMETEQNGIRRIRAGVPGGWTVANKPGTNTTGSVSDIALLTPPSGMPLAAAIYVEAAEPDVAGGETAIAEIVRLVTARL